MMNSGSGNAVSTASANEKAHISQGGNMSSSLPAMEKLDGSADYNTWKFMMELYLIHEDLWEYTMTTPAASDVLGCKRDQKARAKICLMVKPHCLVHVRNVKSAKEAWDALKAAFEDKGLNNRCRLLSKLVNLKLEQFTTVREYVTTMMMVAQQLRDLGKEVDDELLATLMLQGLTETFQPMRLAIENTNLELTTDYVKMKLFQMEDSYQASSNAVTNALQASKKDKRAQRSTNKSRPLKCFICDGPHKAKICPKNTNMKKDASKSSAMATAGEQGSGEWVLDSGASNHMTNRREWLTDFKKLDKQVEIACANGETVYSDGIGNVVDKEMGVSIRGVLYVPGLATNLLSVSTIVSRNLVVVFDKSGFKILKAEGCKVTGDISHSGTVENGVYKIKHCSQDVALASTATDQMVLWHRRMGHLGVRNLTLLKDKMAQGVSFSNTISKLECEVCVLGKQTKQPFKKGNHTRAKEVLELVHTDVCGPMSEKSYGGLRYFLTFIDDYTRKTFVYFLKNKDEVFEKFFEFVTLTECQTGKKLKIIRSDNGKEFVNKRMDQFCKAKGIRHQLTVEYTPEQNGVAERANRTITEKARTMLEEAGLGRRLWAEAVNTAVYLKNRSPTIAVKNMTPEEAWTGKKIDLSFLRVFGCKAYLHVPDQKRKKWDRKSQELVHVGYCEETKGYRLVDPATGDLHKGRDVVFFENLKYENRRVAPVEQVVPLSETVIEMEECPQTTQEERVPDMSIQQEINQSDAEPVEEITENNIVEVEDDEWVTSDEREESDADYPQPDRNNELLDRRYPLRERKAKEFSDFVTYQAATVSQNPLTIQDALSREDRAKWKVAVEEELEALKKNKTWKLVKPPRSCNIVDSKWLFRIKEEAGGKTRYKARLVARGFSQRRGVDYFDTFSPVVRHSSLRVLIALAANMGLKIDQMDVKTAFLNGDLSEVVYMKQPEGFEVKGKEDYVCLLQKSLYGLKQAPRAWNMKLHSELIRLKFRKSDNEPCVYMRSKDGNVIIIAVYVDDILIFWNNEQEMLKVKEDLKSSFEMKDLGKAELMLGIHIVQDANGIKLHQEKYIEKILKAYNMENCKPVVTPSVPGQRLEKPVHGRKPNENVPYQALIGSLMYLAVCTRPDIAHVVNHLSQFNECYEEQHWIAAKRVLRYLKGTKSLGLRYSRKKYQEILEGYADADYAGDYDRRSYSGTVFLIQGGAVSWQSTKQRTVALSTAEAEYVSLSEATKEAIFLRRFIAEMTAEDKKAITIFSDSQSAIAIANNPVHHQRTKHVDIRYHFVRDAVESDVIRLEYRETERMVADVLTKPLPRGKFEWCVNSMGLCV